MKGTRAKKEKLTLALPPEFVKFCADHNVSTIEVLHAFIADVTGIMNYCSNPREDGYSSNGSDERDMAAAYFERTWLGRSY
jgi:hypothetical protein